MDKNQESQKPDKRTSTKCCMCVIRLADSYLKSLSYDRLERKNPLWWRRYTLLLGRRLNPLSLIVVSMNHHA
ncbi:hypothetical protein GDO81_018018 [Engystomops pustulosus]|uniref:Uncharacterized protein n=1 Tax=Engystomops pustulosus TaxID=76066 RepID=A0AAV7AA15_ENGPU|nr:hypothetical protein GDO81_018018 [Engystomops pustulosus]